MEVVNIYNTRSKIRNPDRNIFMVHMLPPHLIQQFSTNHILQMTMGIDRDYVTNVVLT